MLVLLVNFALFCKNLDDTICCRGATTSFFIGSSSGLCLFSWWILHCFVRISTTQFVAGLLQQVCQLREEQPGGADDPWILITCYLISNHISSYHNIISHQSPHILMISYNIWSYMIICYQVLVLGALVGLGCAQLLIILFSFCLCRVSWLHCPPKNVWFCPMGPTKGFKKGKFSEFNSPSVFDKQQKPL